ncbi:MAG: hypothetical protein ACTSQA_07990 [Candidatus Heimdallarchaeaceae archaeon]
MNKNKPVKTNTIVKIEPLWSLGRGNLIVIYRKDATKGLYWMPFTKHYFNPSPASVARLKKLHDARPALFIGNHENEEHTQRRIQGISIILIAISQILGVL